MTRNRIIYGIVGVMVILLVVIIVAGNVLVTGNVLQGSDDTIEIGALMALSGKAAPFGEMIRTGADMAVEEVNREGKLKLKLIYEDTGGDSTKAVNSARKLIDVDGVNIILGAVASSNTLAVAPITERREVILFTPISGSGDITHAGDYVFRNRETAGINAQSMAKFLRDRGVNKVGVFAAQAPNSLSYSGAFIKRFEELGGEVVFSTEYTPEEIDFKTDIIKLKRSEAEAVYLATALGIDSVAITKQLVEFGFEGLVSGSNGLANEEFLRDAGSAAEGVLFTSPSFDEENLAVRNYKARYEALYGKESSIYSANAYDAIMILSDAIIYCGGDEDTACIRDYLYDVKDYPGIGGKTTFDENGDVVKSVAIKVVRNGEFVNYR